LVDDIWRALYRWLLDLGLGARCGTLLEEMVILCGIDILHVALVEEDGCWHGCWIYLGRRA
jgi:hypothetical protein